MDGCAGPRASMLPPLPTATGVAMGRGGPRTICLSVPMCMHPAFCRRHVASLSVLTLLCSLAPNLRPGECHSTSTRVQERRHRRWRGSARTWNARESLLANWRYVITHVGMKL